MDKKNIIRSFLLLMFVAGLSCASARAGAEVPEFDSQKAFAFLVRQCEIGPRNPGSEGHRKGRDYLQATLAQYADSVRTQPFPLRFGRPEQTEEAYNIIARFQPEKKERILLCAHWDTRPWADEDPDPKNHDTPVLGANDGASGVAVLLEVARLLHKHKAPVGVDIVHKSIHFPATLVDGDWDTGGVWEYDLELGPQDLEQDIEVIAYDPAKNEATHTVAIRLDIVPPSLHIDAVPSEVTTAFVWINGTTDAGIPSVLVQSQPYPVENGVFTIQWSLVAGENQINVTVQDEAGNTQRDIVTTTYDYTPPPQPDDIEPSTGLTTSTTLGIAILLMAIVIMVVVLFVTRQRGRR